MRMRDDDDGGEAGGEVKKKGKRRKEKGYGNAIELETADDDL